MNVFDARLIVYLSRVEFHSALFTRAVVALADMYVFKGLVLMALLWWVWFRRANAVGPDVDAARRRDHEIVVIAIASGLVALLLGRMLAHYLPFRVRPIYNPQFQAYFPVTSLQEPVLRTWSAFPSDHAMLWCAVATGIFLASRPVGTYALLHATLLVGLPRMYLGLHHPTDVLAGAALGIGIACIMNMRRIRTLAAAPVLAVAQRYPGVFYALAFMLSFELATQFDELRLLAHGLSKAMSHMM